MQTSDFIKRGFINETQYREAIEALKCPKIENIGEMGYTMTASERLTAGKISQGDFSVPMYTKSPDYPNEVDLAGGMPPVYDQGRRGTCMAQSITALAEYYFHNNYRLSQQFIYWAIKRVDGKEKELRQWLSDPKADEKFKEFFETRKRLAEHSGDAPDSEADSIYTLEQAEEEYRETFAGANVKDAVRALEEYGICEYDLMPYAKSPVYQTEAQSPELQDEDLLARIMQEPLANAATHKIPDRIQILTGNSVDTYRRVLSGAGGKRPMPLVICLSLFKSLCSNYAKKTGWFSLPLPEDEFMGGHAMLAVGYKDTPMSPGGGYLIVRNSWGSSWAWDSKHSGYARVPYAYVENYAFVGAITILQDNASFGSDEDDDAVWGETQTDPMERYIKTAARDMKNRKGRFCISKGQKIIADSSGRVDADTPKNRIEFAENGYSWE